MAKTRIGILFGGLSAEKEISLKSGLQVTHYLPEKYEKIPLFMDSNAQIWHLSNELLTSESTQQVEQNLTNNATHIPYEKLPEHIDIAFPTFHGRYGEDGCVQGLLELLKLPYVGSGVRASAVAMNKNTSKILYRDAKLPVAKDLIINRTEGVDINTLTERLGLPLVLKPVCEGSSVGISIVKEKNLLKEAIEKAFEYDHQVLVEEFLKGTEITCAVFGNEHPIGLPIIEIVTKNEFFDLEAKYDPQLTDEICPARINETLTKQAQDYAIRAHLALGCRTYSRTDMIIRDNKLYLLETNTLPGMTAASLLPKAAKTHGWDFSTFLDKTIQISLPQ
ncbi:MAG: D-alanine--D-alanine ligase [bacterium]